MLIYLYYLDTDVYVSSCICFFKLALTKPTSNLQDVFKDKYMNGNSNVNRNHYKAMQDTIESMFVNENINRIYYFVHSYHETLG